ncbi:tellurite resistance TerB family protein [Rhizobiaceae bacterium n13]|uniref:Tellurite resistance TerB family protein n=1 Tax=Ferirhizobium litorale TaxID=2927786 RepID=A0AAE3U284_9HYPH|nr:tellurite resistance TerB family protein [Fererhizobium litorale]MDI7862274.1 tellurite resistance TerB family protein [Fererhizobium litorale]MDI7922452.1 tellurite resistance TerB family protein [Fererhizobium litorale]
MNSPITSHDALIYVMVMASAVDSAMSDKELGRIGQLIRNLPAFETFDADRLIAVSQDCADLLSGPEGMDITLETIRDALPPRLYDTAYALAVEVMAADSGVRPEEIRLLQLLRDRLRLDKLTCAALERGAIARYRTI